MVWCAVFGCNRNNRKGTPNYNANTKFFRFPTNPITRKKWLRATFRSGTINAQNMRICSDHFDEIDYEPRKGNKKFLKPGTVPHKNIMSHDNFMAAYEQYPLVAKQITENLVTFIKEESFDLENENIPNSTVDPEPEVDFCAVIEDEITKLEKDVTFLKIEKRKIKVKLNKERISIRNVENTLTKTIFGPGQLSKFKYPKKKVRFRNNEMLHLIALQTSGPQLYNVMRRKGYPFPEIKCIPNVYFID